MANEKKSSTKGTEKKAKPASDKATRKPKAGAEQGDETLAASSQKKPAKTGKPAVKRNPLLPRTLMADSGDLVKWRVVDATGLPLGRLCSVVATALMGKDKPAFTKHHDTGDSIIVLNASKVVLTGNKWDDKTYHYHTNFPGGIKEFTAKELREKHPERLIERAVWGMLPKGHMGRNWFRKLRVFAGAEHDHKAQTPEKLKLPDLGTWEKA